MQRVFQFGERVGFPLSLVLWIGGEVRGSRRLSYRVKFVAGSEWLYEGRPRRGSLRSFQFPCHILADGYAAHCKVQIPGEALWLEEVPVWGHRRPREVMGAR